MRVYVVNESRIGPNEMFPHYSVFGPYKSKDYARKVVRDLAKVHGAAVDHTGGYHHGHYRTGLLNVHRVSIVEDIEHYVDARHVELDLSRHATKYAW